MDQDACDFLVLIATKLHELAKAESSPKKIYSPTVQVATKKNFKHILLGKLWGWEKSLFLPLGHPSRQSLGSCQMSS
jgi:hypothetical protein